MTIFTVINPVMGGDIPKTFEADTAEKAAEQLWENLTTVNKLFVENLPIFAFTLKAGDKIEYFLVKEKVDGKTVTFKIENITEHVMKNTTAAERADFLKESNAAQVRIDTKPTDGKTGGHKHRYNDSSSSSSSNDLESVDDYLRYIRRRSYRSPLYYWWYSPSIYRVRNIFSPIFTPSVSPYVQLYMPYR
jgi:hypothetical protein